MYQSTKNKAVITNIAKPPMQINSAVNPNSPICSIYTLWLEDQNLDRTDTHDSMIAPAYLAGQAIAAAISSFLTPNTKIPRLIAGV